jgi:FKBP-type peptidyl-prolyl cis-trans isomerase
MIGITAATSSCIISDARAEEYVSMEALKGVVRQLLLRLQTQPCPTPHTGSFTFRFYAGKDYGKTPMKYPDFEMADNGLQYKDLREGTGAHFYLVKGRRLCHLISFLLFN